MKKFIFYLVLITFHSSLFTLHSISQQCLPEGITFTTQAQIDSFQINYPGCTEIEGDVTIYGADITDLSGLTSLTSIGGDMWFRNNGALTSLTGLDNLSSITGSLQIGGWWPFSNNALQSLNGLNNLTSVGGGMEIANNPLLKNLVGLESLTSIGGGLRIGNNLAKDNNVETGHIYSDSIQNLTGLENLVTIGGPLLLQCYSLVSLEGLEKLDSIGGLWIEGIPVISLMGLNNLSYIGDEGVKIRLTGLTSLTGLENVNSIAGSIDIVFNEKLTSLTGLPNIQANTISGLYIYDNPSLSICHVQSICDYLADTNAIVEIHDNASGCNSEEEVAEACAIGVDESAVSSQQSAVRVYPNPASGISHFAFHISQEQHVTLKIYDLHGREVATVVDEVIPAGEHVVSFDAGSLRPGVYVYRKLVVGSRQHVLNPPEADEGSAVGKLIKF